MKRTTKLRELIRDGGPGVVPGATDCFTARIIEEIGFPVLYITGGGAANTLLGRPDVGLLTMTEMVSHIERITDSVSIPVIADADTGYGGTANVQRTVRAYERIGVAGLHMEDQVFPKRCGHFEGKAVVPEKDMLYRLQAAMDARTDPDFLIIARTDARGPEGFERAIERALVYRDCGADAIFVEAPSSLQELSTISETFKGTPLVANMIERSRTPLVPEKELLKMGFNIILYANAALYLGSFAIRQGLQVLREQGTTASLVDRMTSFNERQTLVALDRHDLAEKALVTKVDQFLSSRKGK